jgi:soluble cytochrome b562
MKLCAFLSCLLLASFTLSPALLHADEPTTELGEQMEIIGQSFRSLRREIGNPDNMTRSTELVDKMIRAAEASLAFTPSLTEEQPLSEQEQFVADYRKDLEAFVAALHALQDTLQAGDHETAKGLVKDLRLHPRHAHKRYKKPDEE